MNNSKLLRNVKTLLEMANTGVNVLHIQQKGVEMVEEITNSEGAYFHTFDENENAIDLAVWSKRVHHYCHAEASKHYPLEEAGIWADCVREKQAVIHNDYQGLPASEKGGLPKDHFPLSRHMSVPIYSADKIVSITGVANKKEPYDESDIDNVKLLAEVIWNITQQRRAQVILQNYAFEDGLTGIANRRRFDETINFEWNRHRRSGQEISLIMLDIDLFKGVNDQLGHEHGDIVLQQIAHALKESFRRSGELVCRYGGEEFVVILPDTNHAQAIARANFSRLAILNLQLKHPTPPVSPHITVSGGVATLVPRDDNFQRLTEIADANLYKAKSLGRNCIV